MAPLVKTISRGRQPSAPATRSRAASSAARARRPSSCPDEGLPHAVRGRRAPRPPRPQGAAAWKRSRRRADDGAWRGSTFRRKIRGRLPRAHNRVRPRPPPLRPPAPAPPASARRARRQLRLVHPELGPPPRAARRRRRGRAQRRGDGRAGARGAAGGRRDLAGAVVARGGRHLRGARPRLRRRDAARPGPRRLPRPPGHRRRVRRAGGAAVRPVHGRATTVRSTGRGLLAGLPAPVPRGALPHASSSIRRPCRTCSRSSRVPTRARSWRWPIGHGPWTACSSIPSRSSRRTAPRILAAFVRRCGVRPRTATRRSVALRAWPVRRAGPRYDRAHGRLRRPSRRRHDAEGLPALRRPRPAPRQAPEGRDRRGGRRRREGAAALVPRGPRPRRPPRRMREAQHRVLRGVRRRGPLGVQRRRARRAAARLAGDRRREARGSLDATAEAYAQAHLAPGGDFEVDAITMHALSRRRLAGAVRHAAVASGKGLYVLVRTSNPGAGDLQDLDVGGVPLYQRTAALVRAAGDPHRGRCGLSLGRRRRRRHLARAGAALRAALPTTPFLVPGYGAQGATAAGRRGGVPPGRTRGRRERVPQRDLPDAAGPGDAVARGHRGRGARREGGAPCRDAPPRLRRPRGRRGGRRPSGPRTSSSTRTATTRRRGGTRRASSRGWGSVRARVSSTSAAARGGTLAPSPRAGVRVTGVDLSAALLAEARGVRPGLPGAPTYVRADMRALPFFGPQFDGVVSLFTSFGYFDAPADDARVFAEVARVLAPGGRFLLDFLHAPVVRATLVPASVEARARRPPDHVTRRIDDETPGGPYVRKTIHLVSSSDDEPLQDRRGARAAPHAPRRSTRCSATRASSRRGRPPPTSTGRRSTPRRRPAGCVPRASSREARADVRTPASLPADLVAALVAHQRQVGAGPAAERAAAALGAGARAVVTGQQPGLLGGPLLVLHKALGALAHARALTTDGPTRRRGLLGRRRRPRLGRGERRDGDRRLRTAAHARARPSGRRPQRVGPRARRRGDRVRARGTDRRAARDRPRARCRRARAPRRLPHRSRGLGDDRPRASPR